MPGDERHGRARPPPRPDRRRAADQAQAIADGWQLLSRRGIVAPTMLSVLVLSVLGVALTLRWPVGSRLMALWAIPGYQFVGFAAAQHLFTGLQFASWSAFQIEFRLLPTAVVAVLVLLAAWWSGRAVCRKGRTRRADPPLGATSPGTSGLPIWLQSVMVLYSP